MSADRPDDLGDLDALVARLAPVDDGEIRDHPDDEAAQALLGHIVAGDLTTARRVAVPGEQARRPKVVTVTAAALIAAAVIVAALIGLVPSPRTFRTASIPVVSDTPSGHLLTARIPARDISHGRVTWSKVPTFVALYSGRTLIGYVKKTAIEHPPIVAEPQMEPAPIPQSLRFCTGSGIDIYDGTHILIGHVYPGTGFVALGGSACVPSVILSPPDLGGHR
jgi:hypothetical protein